MNNNELKNWKRRFLIYTLSMIIVLGLGCVEKTPSGEEPQTTSPIQGEIKPSAPMNVNLSIVGTPSLNQPVELTFTVTSLINAPNTTVHVLLPEGFSVVSGDLSWNGNIAENETFQLKTSVKAVATGYWTIEASAKSIKSYQIVFGKTDKIYINVLESTAIVSKLPLQNYSRSNRTMLTQLSSNFTRPLLVNETSDENLLTPSPVKPES